MDLISADVCAANSYLFRVVDEPVGNIADDNLLSFTVDIDGLLTGGIKSVLAIASSRDASWSKEDSC